MDNSELDRMATLSHGSSLGDAVSGREQSLFDEDDELYIPERRPSLDLGPSPMDTSHWHYVDQALSPAQSYMSMTSEDNSINISPRDGSPTRVQLNRTDSYSSCYSLDSDDCEKKIPRLGRKEDTVSELTETPILNQVPNEIRHPSLTVAFTFKAISETLGRLSKEDIKRFKMMLWKRCPQSFNTPPQSLDMVDLVDRMLECFNLEVSLQITKNLLEEIGRNRMSDYLQTLCIRNEVRYNLKETLKRKYGEVCEEFAMQGERRPFDDVFTDLYITSTCDNGPNIEHEVMTIEKLDSNQKAGKLLSTKDILSAERLEHSHFKFMLITGVAGSGKSMAVRRLILDWIEEKSHQHVSYLFPLPFRELKEFENSTTVSVLEIIQTLYPETKKLRDEDYTCTDCKIMFLFDGLDEYNGKLDFQNTSILIDIKDRTTLNVIVVNLLRERLLYRSLYLVFSRPQVHHYIPWDTRYDEIDVQGFRDPQKDEYFKKRFKDPDQAARVIAYINSSKTLRIMCHLPLFCSLVADEYQHIFRGQVTWAEPPRSITYMYTKLLLALRQHRKFRAPDLSLDKERDFLIKVGKLAFNMLNQGQYKITKYDWKEVELSDVEVVINSGLCTQYITKPYVLQEEKVISFIHPTMQEYLAALYVFLSFTNQEKNIYEKQLKHKFKGRFKADKVMELYKSALDSSLQCDDGKLDIFLRFLLGMALKTNLDLLQPFCTCTVKWPTLIEDAAALIRKRISENQHPDRNSNLQRCLEELSL